MKRVRNVGNIPLFGQMLSERSVFSKKVFD